MTQFKTYQSNWTNMHSDIFSEFIVRMNENRIRYFILRNFEGLPQINNSKDIDIIIEPGSYEQSFILLKEVLTEFGISYYRVVKYERVHCIYGIDYNKEFSIHIDLIEGYLSKGYEIFSFTELFNQTIEYKNFRVLNETYDAIMLLYYKVIGTKQLKPQYKEKITAIFKGNQAEINKILRTTLGKKMSSFMAKCLSNQDYESIIKHAHQLSKVSKTRVFIKKPFKTTYNITKFLLEKIYRIVYCPRKYQNFIAVEGADGTGKSTFIEGLIKAIAYYNVTEETKSHVYHHRPTILPNLGAMGEKAGIMKEDKDFTNPHRRKPAGIISSFIRMTYYWLDYLIGVPLMIRKDVQFDRYTIYDRYIYDFIVDPYRSRINLPNWLRTAFAKLVLQPRIVFVLLTDAETIYKRKQELSIDEINRQLGEFTKLAKSNKRFVVIDASQTPEQMVEQAARIIIERFALKLK